MLQTLKQQHWLLTSRKLIGINNTHTCKIHPSSSTYSFTFLNATTSQTHWLLTDYSKVCIGRDLNSFIDPKTVYMFLLFSIRPPGVNVIRSFPRLSKGGKSAHHKTEGKNTLPTYLEWVQYLACTKYTHFHLHEVTHWEQMFHRCTINSYWQAAHS